MATGTATERNPFGLFEVFCEGGNDAETSSVLGGGGRGKSSSDLGVGLHTAGLAKDIFWIVSIKHNFLPKKHLHLLYDFTPYPMLLGGEV